MAASAFSGGRGNVTAPMLQVTDEPTVLQALPQPLRELRQHIGGAGHAGPRQQQRKLVAADASHCIGAAHRLAHDLAHSGQDQVSLAVPVNVVHPLEVVQVDISERKRLAIPRRQRQAVLQALLERPQVQDSGQGIPAGEALLVRRGGCATLRAAWR